MLLKETCVRSYQLQEESMSLADYHLYALLGYYMVQHPGVEIEQLRRDMEESRVRQHVGGTALRLLRSGIK